MHTRECKKNICSASSIIDELTGGAQLASCLEREKAADTNTPDLSDVDVLMDIYNNIDERIRMQLERNQEYVDIKNFDSSLTKAATVFGRDSGPVTELNRFRDTLRFFIRHAAATQNWSDKAIDANWQNIVYAVFSKGLELKQAHAEVIEVDGREMETAFSALIKRLLG